MSANPSSVGSSSTMRNACDALDTDPTIFSPILNAPEIEDTSKIFVIESQVLTLPVAPLTEPVTVSLNMSVSYTHLTLPTNREV